MTDHEALIKGVRSKLHQVHKGLSDHARGCQGRNYSCDCGYDEEVQELCGKAADMLEQPGDAERERLAQMMDKAAATHRAMAAEDAAAGMLAYKAIDTVLADDAERIAQLLRRPAEPVVTVHEDYISHHEDWRSACEIAMLHADCASDRAYWQHQIDTLDKIAALNVSQPGVK